MASSLNEILSSLNVNLVELQASFKQLQEKIADYEFIGSGSEESVKVLKDYNKTKQLLETIQSLEDSFSQVESNKELLSDPELGSMAEEELAILEESIANLANTLKKLTVKPLPYDDNKALIEIRPGVGGVEASLFAEDLFKMYQRYASNNKYKLEIYSIAYNAEGGINEAVFLVDEAESFSEFRFESGVHRVQRVPTTESAGRIHTSSASIVVMPQIMHTDVNIKQDELRIDVFRAGGPGGQSVNTTDSAVRITHLPTGITVSCQNGKSQHKNKEMAMNVLLSKLQELEDEKRAKQTGNIRSNAIKGGDRSMKIRTYNFPQGRITDHRIPHTWYNLDAVMNGDIAEVLQATSEFMRSLPE